MQIGADILLVIATVVGVFATSSAIGGWTVRRWPVVALIALGIAVGLFVYVHRELPEGLAWHSIPDAFISVAARILN